MPVTVRLTPGPHGAREKTHPTADDVTVDDGHLILTAGDGRAETAVAVYAPGAWTSAEVQPPGSAS